MITEFELSRITLNIRLHTSMFHTWQEKFLSPCNIFLFSLLHSLSILYLQHPPWPRWSISWLCKGQSTAAISHPSIQRNANSLQPDPVSLQCYPNRAVQPSWNQHHECFHHSCWDISIFIVRNHPHFTIPSPAAPPITLALLGLKQHIRLILGAHIYTVFQSERRYTERADMMPLEEAHCVEHQSWCRLQHLDFWQHFNSLKTKCQGKIKANHFSASAKWNKPILIYYVKCRLSWNCFYLLALYD